MELKEVLEATLQLAYRELAVHEMKQYEETQAIGYWERVIKDFKEHIEKINSAS